MGPGLLLLLLAGAAGAGYHHLDVRIIGTDQEEGDYKYVMIARVDDFVFAKYHSDTQEFRPTQEWVKRALGADYVREQTREFRGYAKGSKANVKSWMKLYNQTSGFHVEQVHVGCSLSNDVLGDQKFQYAYDGEDFISFDIRQQSWVAAVPVAFAQKLWWENSKTWTQFVQWYLKEKCLETLKSLLQEGRAILARRVSPVVSVSRRNGPNGSVSLSCHVRGFYPHPIQVSWVQEEGEILPETFTSGILPSTNDTFYLWTSLELAPTSAIRRYACQVEHSSLPETLLTWVPDQTDTPPPGILAFIVAGGLILVVAVLGFVIFWRKKSGGITKRSYAPASKTLDTTGNAHPAEYVQQVAVQVVANREKKFKCLVHHKQHCRNVSEMRRNLEASEESPQLITDGCCAHLMHLLAKDFSAPEMKATVVDIAKYFRNNHFASAALKKEEEPN